MTAPFIRFVNDIEPVGDTEINKFRDDKEGGNKNVYDPIIHKQN